MGTANGMLVLGSLLLLVHATLCAIQHREWLKAVQQTFTYPFEIAMQCIAAVAIGIWGIIGMHGTFMPIRTAEVLAKQTVDNMEPGPDFYHFRNRQLRVPKSSLAYMPTVS